MAAHAYYLMKTDVSMDDVFPAMVLTNYLISIYYVAVGRYDRASPAKPEIYGFLCTADTSCICIYEALGVKEIQREIRENFVRLSKI